ncbi:MAG: helix-turn-helix transcriptional regulator [Gammaproteobacteria bacterium]|nr:helix-turn-helix transcriptional regulator [Gammaproteobacteria bacterium]
MQQPIADNFQSACRHWRRLRKLSQLDLALAANVSQRHISWLETGRSQPSRDMVIRLAEALAIPLRERNVLLQCAGFAAIYRETALQDPQMTPVLSALKQVLHHHDPLPAVVVDRMWNITMRNSAAELMLALSPHGQHLQAQEAQHNHMINLLELTLHPHGLRRHITNWEQAATALIRRLQTEALASGDPAQMARFQALQTLAGAVDSPDMLGAGLLPVLPMEMDIDGVALKLFSVISTFGTPQDITTDELRIEAFYPADDATAAFFTASAA